MARKNGDWTIKDSRTVFKNDFITLREDDVTKPDGSPGKYAVVQSRSGIQALALDNEGNVYLVREFRYALEGESLEAVGGTSEEGEPPFETARRELREELGIEAEDFLELGEVHHTTSIIDSTTTLILARKLKFTEPHREASEKIKLEKLPLREAVAKAINGEITHATTCTLILCADAAVKRESR